VTAVEARLRQPTRGVATHTPEPLRGIELVLPSLALGGSGEVGAHPPTRLRRSPAEP